MTSTHPALIDSAIRWRGVGGWGATATLMRAIDAGALSVGEKNGALSLALVSGVATPKRVRPGGLFVEHGHVRGLSSFDRDLLTMLFDDMSHAPTTSIPQAAAWRRSHPLQFWNRLKAWRECVDGEARRLQSGGRLQMNRQRAYRSRGALVDALGDGSVCDKEWSGLAAVALTLNLDDIVAKYARERADALEDYRTGSAGVIWLAGLHSGRRTGLDVLCRLFSPLRPSSYAPAQYTTLTLPPHRRPRMVDDGSLRLGG